MTTYYIYLIPIISADGVAILLDYVVWI